MEIALKEVFNVHRNIVRGLKQQLLQAQKDKCGLEYQLHSKLLKMLRECLCGMTCPSTSVTDRTRSVDVSIVEEANEWNGKSDLFVEIAQQIKDVIKQRFASTNAIGDSCSTSLPSKSTGQRVLFPDDPLQPTSEGGQTKLVLRSNDVQTYNNIKQIPSKSIKYRKNTCYGVEEKGPACSVDSGEASSSINEIHGVISTITRSAVRKGNDAYFSIPRTLIPHHQNNRHHSGWQSNSKPVENESKTVVRETVVMKQNWMEGDEVGVQDVSGTFCAVTTAGALSDMCRLGCENGATVYHRSNDVSLPCCSGTRVARFAEQSLSVSAGRGDELLSTDCRSVDPTSVCLSAASDSVVMWVACDVGASGVANSSVGDTRSSHTGVMASMESSVPSSTGEAVSLTSASLTGDHCSPVCPPVDRSPTLFDEDDDIICDSAVVQSGFLSANRLQPSSFLCAINHPLLSATDLLCRQHKQFCGPYRPPSLTTPTSVRSPCHNTLTLTDSPSPSLLKACLVRKRRVDSDGVPSLCRPATCADTEPITVYGEPTVPCQTMPEPDRPRMDVTEPMMLEQEDDTSGDVTLDPEFAVPHQHVRRNKNNKVHRQSSRASASQSGRCLGNDMPVSSAVQLNDSFDRLPVSLGREHVYMEVVRKQSNRRKLHGFSCKQCQQYYCNMGLSDTEMAGRIAQCSRHRAQQAPPSTPDHFWSVGFPDTVDDAS